MRFGSGIHEGTCELTRIMDKENCEFVVMGRLTTSYALLKGECYDTVALSREAPFLLGFSKN
jgi:hypothetical protein